MHRTSNLHTTQISGLCAWLLTIIMHSNELLKRFVWNLNRNDKVTFTNNNIINKDSPRPTNRWNVKFDKIEKCLTFLHDTLNYIAIVIDFALCEYRNNRTTEQCILPIESIHHHESLRIYSMCVRHPCLAAHFRNWLGWKAGTEVIFRV